MRDIFDTWTLQELHLPYWPLFDDTFDMPALFVEYVGKSQPLQLVSRVKVDQKRTEEITS